MICIKIYKQGTDILLGACDEQIIGKKFEDGKFVLDVKKEFYDGKRIPIDILKKHLDLIPVPHGSRFVFSHLGNLIEIWQNLAF